MSRLEPVIADVFGRPLPTIREAIRQLRAVGQLPGAYRGGRTAPCATAADLARVVLAMLSGERPFDAPQDLERSAGLIDSAGGQEVLLLDLLEMAIADLAWYGDIEGVADARLLVTRPWPLAQLKFTYSDGSTRVIKFHHEDAENTGDKERDADNIKRLQSRWRHRPGVATWCEIRLNALKELAGALDAPATAPDHPRAWASEMGAAA